MFCFMLFYNDFFDLGKVVDIGYNNVHARRKPWLAKVYGFVLNGSQSGRFYQSAAIVIKCDVNVCFFSKVEQHMNVLACSSRIGIYPPAFVVKVRTYAEYLRY